MPHSSGGGSAGGGFHSTSGGSGSSGPRVSNRPFVGCHCYVYYYMGRQRRYYADYKQKPISKKGTIAVTIFLVGLLIIAAICFSQTKVNPSKLKGNYSKDILIVNSMNVIKNENKIRTVLSNFEDVTGIVPAVVVVDNDTWQKNYGNLEDYAYDKYLELFKDEYHWLLVYSVSKTSPNNWFFEFMQGDNTDSILHDTNDFIETFHKDLYYSLDTAIVNGFSNPEKFMEPYIDEGFIALGMMLSIMSIGGIAAVWYEYITKRGIENQYEVSLDAKEIKCEYCDNTFIKGDNNRCPHCGAVIDYFEEKVNS